MGLQPLLSSMLLIAAFAGIARGNEFPESAGAAPSDSESFFEQKIRPLLIERCYQCHSDAKKVKGGLKLDSREGWKTGGDSGPALVPGKPDESLLVKAVRYQDADLRMPPAGKLSDDEIALLVEWVTRGAPDPRGTSHPDSKPAPSSGKPIEHWAYQPLSKSPAPTVKRNDWPLADTDRFILAALEAKGLSPAPDADRYSWLRRLSLDLTGLPPTPQDIRQFMDDNSEQAFERVVDRLLGTRAFGERWARPWLDLVGYADQIGSANNVPAEYAWRFRDYVIRAIQEDKPFDRFVREQLAGDLLSAGSVEERQDQLTATGFLVLGNVNIVEADKLVMEMDLVDQQIEKVGKTFLGMTLNCVRCHDHKFDPITLGDYYGLAGIFASTESTYKDERGVWSSVTKSQLPETFEQFTRRETALREHDRVVASTRFERAAAEARVGELNTLIDASKNEVASDADRAKPRADLEKERNELTAKLKNYDKRLLHLNYLRPSPPVTFALKDSPTIGDARIQVRGNPHVLGAAVPRGFVRVATHSEVPRIPADQSGRRQLAEWLTGAASPLVARVTVNRIWQALFGRGIVGSVDYFGVRGETPTHPELLDDLAERFIRNGWSRKRLIRELVLSRTYRQRSDGDESIRAAMAVDPENRLLWRMSPRRLEAEMIRDSVLAVSGGLDECPGGPALSPEFIENVGGLDPKDVNPISFSVSKFRDEQQRFRTIYLPVVRSSEQRGPGDVLNFFDFAQPAMLTGGRPTTSVASQALFLLNGPLLGAAAKRLAEAITADPALVSDGDRIAAVYLRVMNRPPTTDEIFAAGAFVGSLMEQQTGAAGPNSGQVTAWQQLIHALLASNEFLFRL